jgi:APA family basic amino acid/polyamine antiporter
MAGVLLNLILGLSRVVLAMGRRGDLPSLFSRLNTQRTVPRRAVLFASGLIGVFIAFGNLELAWSFSAFTVLLYYGITGAAALAIPREQSLFQPWVGVMGLVGCVSLAFFIDLQAILGGLGTLAGGFLWFIFWSRRHRTK